MPSTVGRIVVAVQTNKSGGSVAYGDVVITDSANDSSFTTTTSGGLTSAVIGVCVEPNGIANNSSGRVQYQGTCPQVNCNASVTRGNFVKTHTVAKQATGSASRTNGTFGVALTTSSTPIVLLYGLPDISASGNIAGDTIWDAAGDLVQGTGADTAAKLSAGTQGYHLRAGGASTALVWAARELDYVQTTSNTTINVTTEGTALTVLTGTSQSYAAEPIVIDVFCPRLETSTTSGGTIVVVLFDSSTVLGRIGLFKTNSTTSIITTFFGSYRYTPTAATHQYIVKVYSTAGTNGSWNSGAGGTGVELPSFIRVTRAI